MENATAWTGGNEFTRYRDDGSGSWVYDAAKILPSTAWRLLRQRGLSERGLAYRRAKVLERKFAGQCAKCTVEDLDRGRLAHKSNRDMLWLLYVNTKLDSLTDQAEAAENEGRLRMINGDKDIVRSGEAMEPAKKNSLDNFLADRRFSVVDIAWLLEDQETIRREVLRADLHPRERDRPEIICSSGWQKIRM
jgi:hypothetical protein